MSDFSLQHQLRRAVCIALLVLVDASAHAEDQQVFASAEEAVQALVAVLSKDDLAGLDRLLGPGSEEILSSGDAVADKRGREDFLALYKERHTLVAEGADKMELQVGKDDWPLPIPLIKRDGHWLLDGAAGADEIIYRRVGSNELGAIAVCRGFVDAQYDYAEQGHDDNPPGLFAAKLFSDAGQQNGLYWPVADGEPVSPGGPGIATAAAEGYRAASGGVRNPYHGYYYRMLFAQGSHARGGASEYFVDGQLVSGVALLAWPAEYGVSGVKSFMINQDGLVYEKDLGEETDEVAETIQSFDPDSSWSKVVTE